MRTTFELVNIIYQKLVAYAPLTAANLTGEIRKQGRALNSVLEDIIINALPIDNAQLQSAVININVHVPNILVGTGEVQDESQPNLKRIKELTDLCIAAVDNSYGSFYNCSVQQQVLIQDKSEFYNNIRLKIYSINNSN